MFNDSILSSLSTNEGASSATIFMLVVVACMLIVRIYNLPLPILLHNFMSAVMKLFSNFIGKQERAYHRDIEIGKITEKRVKAKLYNFLSELIIDLNLLNSGITPYELLIMTVLLTTTITFILSKLIFGNIIMAILLTPLAILAVFCVMYTKANVAHDARIENVIEAENIICNNIKVGVVVAVRESLDVIPKEVRPHFKDFIDNIEQKNYHIKTALLELNSRLGSIADDFIKKCIVFEMEEEHGIASMFSDVVEINNIRMEMRTEMKRAFEQVLTDFLIGAGMIGTFLFGVIAIFPNVRVFYFQNMIGQLILALDALLFIIEFVFITYLRAKEL